jgi:hypothetical protein
VSTARRLRTDLRATSVLDRTDRRSVRAPVRRRVITSLGREVGDA